MNTVLFREVEVGGAVTDVEVRDGVVSAVGPNLLAAPGSELVQGAGGALLPGLHDHHLHLLALAAHVASADLAGVNGLDGLAGALRNAPRARGWIRATGYHE